MEPRDGGILALLVLFMLESCSDRFGDILMANLTGNMTVAAVAHSRASMDPWSALKIDLVGVWTGL